ncbi:YfcC family protein [Vreelandella malpeensis]|uniref:YfcC family protein n=1 Tax=Vreelandella malpeensis TaxID=1172368 RepID=A0ABS8DNR3_9GAMM|nr:AbgT family transporter [Halomonas malpeensis]MCB8887920.1 YfcC family protein [Halomonas malpeensis]
MPDAFVILFSLLLLAWLSSFFIPAGQFERTTEGRPTVIPGSFELIESRGLNILDIFLSIQQGFISSANLIALVLVMGGAIMVVESTGAINAGIKGLVDKTRGRKYLLTVVVSTAFGVVSAIGVGSNAVIAFIPLGIVLARALKLDAIAGIAIVYLGYFSGSAAAVFDPITLGVAQSIAGLPLFSGAGLRIAVFFVLLGITVLYVCRYIKRIDKDPTQSLMGATPFGDNVATVQDEQLRFTRQHLVILGFFVTCLGVFIYGSLQRGWGINELSAIFMINAIGSAVLARMGANEFVRVFMEGAKGMLYGAFIIGIAKGITVLMMDGMILDTVVNSVFVPLSTLPSMLGAIAVFFFNLFFNFLVPSGSGQAAVVMPILTPLADMLEITRQTAVIAFKLGDGITNIITPTSGVLMSVLAIGGVPWGNWVRFAFPLVCLWTLAGIAFVVIAVMINYGPF